MVTFHFSLCLMPGVETLGAKGLTQIVTVENANKLGALPKLKGL